MNNPTSTQGNPCNWSFNPALHVTPADKNGMALAQRSHGRTATFEESMRLQKDRRREVLKSPLPNGVVCRVSKIMWIKHQPEIYAKT